MKLKKCEKCGEEYFVFREACPKCGQPNSNDSAVSVEAASPDAASSANGARNNSAASVETANPPVEEPVAEKRKLFGSAVSLDKIREKVSPKVIFVIVAIVVVIVAFACVFNLVVAPKNEAENKYKEIESVLSDYSGSTLDVQSVIDSLEPLKNSNSFDLLEQSEKEKIDAVLTDCNENVDAYNQYLSCKSAYESAKNDSTHKLGIESSRNSTFATFSSALTAVGTSSRYYGPIDDMYVELQGLVESSVEAYNAEQEKKAAEEAAKAAAAEKAKQEAAEKAAAEKAEKEAAAAAKKDQCLVDANGKQMWKVTMSSSTFKISGSFSGSGNFIVKLLDSNQELYKLIANEIGSYSLNKSVSVTKNKVYYLVIECSSGTWNASWTGTYGN